MSAQPRLIVVAGPTASGKSHLAVKLALAIGGEVVNCDSMQVYRQLDIGTAKPPEQERGSVPHHLYDLINPNEVYSAGRYMTDARRVCLDVSARGLSPIVVGGTGLYLRALLEGVFEGPGRSEELRKRLHLIADRRGPGCLHKILARRDPEAASRIQPADRIRIVRALEVYWATGAPISTLQPTRNPISGYAVIKFGLNLPRSELYARINRRVEQMFAGGLVQEVTALLAQGYSPDLKCFEALGYRPVVAFLRGELSMEEAIDRTKLQTRRYAKRQLTWFRREAEMHWVPFPGEDPRAFDAVMGLVRTED